MPAELVDLVTAYTRRLSLEAVATLRTQREVHVLLGADGLEVAELALDTVSVLETGADDVDRARVLTRFRELELEERGDGDTRADDLDDVVLQLSAAGAVAGDLVSKGLSAGR